MEHTITFPSLQLNENERVLLVLHHHWFVLARELVAVMLMIAVGIAAYAGKSAFYPFVGEKLLYPLFSFLLTVYALLILLLTFAIWINYRLDVLVITSRRLIDVEQRGLFNREVSEFLIEKVQDITTEVPTMIATFLDFGTIHIQTAGEKSFHVHEVPHLEKAKQLILRCSENARKDENKRI